MTPIQTLCALLGACLIAVILWDAFETVLMPRRIGRRLRITSLFYIVAWRGWRAACRRVRAPSRREGWLGTLLQFAAGSMATLEHGRAMALVYMSGETFFTLGYGDLTPSSGFGRAMAVLEAGMGFGFLGTVVGYLPTMYGAFSQREVGIAQLDARAGSPPTAAEALRRLPFANGRPHSDARQPGSSPPALPPPSAAAAMAAV